MNLTEAWEDWPIVVRTITRKFTIAEASQLQQIRREKKKCLLMLEVEKTNL